ncbi:Hypothetical Protein SLY_0761 [Strawberry lethal yellows phytoplasma (CPA) str. NZSb11]|uniref:Uncharacterized protein n=1 Tax=Strawberry lethal yellows phytoplasma (CPA) str. NZSb11 TaxID=980422 RepID=R4RQ95_PHYAS|nr:Hypothetical Protein SLY_0761 [Strawberry lethal yellows phytoplasma (CPA) str. NZSb11]
MNEILKEQKNRNRTIYSRKNQKLKETNLLYPTLSESELMYERLTKITKTIREILRMYAESSDINLLINK